MCLTPIKISRPLLRHGGIVCIVVFGICGCTSRKPPAPTPPALAVAVSSFVGSPLSGPTTAPAPDISPNDVLQINVAWIALQQFTADRLLPLDSQSQLTSAPFGSGAVLAVGEATRQIRFGADPLAAEFMADVQSGSLGHTAQVTQQAGMVARGTSVRFSCTLPGSSMQAVTLSLGRVTTDGTVGSTTRPNDGMMSISVEQTLNDGGSAFELAFLDNLALSNGERFVVLIPYSAKGVPWQAVAAEITVGGLESPASDSIDTLRKELNESSASALAATTWTAAGDKPAIQSAIAALSRPEPIRPALVFLASKTNAQIAADFVLVSDDAALNQYRDLVLANLAEQANPQPAEALSWTLDRTALLFVIDQSANEKLSPQLASVLVLHTGEVGRHPDSLKDVVMSVGNAADLQRRLVGENFIALEDTAPGARVRAYDWLKSQGKAPAGFDPMADRKARREAINDALGSSGGAP